MVVGHAVNSSVDLPTPEPDSPRLTRKPYRFATLCATVENPDMKDQYGASSVPIYQTATFKGIAGEYDYTRSGNPTRTSETWKVWVQPSNVRPSLFFSVFNLLSVDFDCL